MKRYILGAGEQGKIMIPYIMESFGFKPDGFFDDFKTGEKIVGTFNDLEKILTIEDELYLGIGNNKIRGEIYNRLKDKVQFPSLIHKSAIIANSVELGEGITIAPGVIINPLSKIGNGVILNTGVVIEHENAIEDFVNMEPTSATMGGVKIGEYSTIGPGSIICEDMIVGKYCHIGAGSIVLKNIPNYSIAWGTPAKIIKKNEEFL